MVNMCNHSAMPKYMYILRKGDFSRRVNCTYIWAWLIVMNRYSLIIIENGIQIYKFKVYNIK